MRELEAWLIVGATVLLAAGVIFGEYVFRRLTGRWPPKGEGSGVAGSAAIIAANIPDDDGEGGDSSEGGD